MLLLFYKIYGIVLQKLSKILKQYLDPTEKENFLIDGMLTKTLTVVQKRKEKQIIFVKSAAALNHGHRVNRHHLWHCFHKKFF